MRDLSTKSNDSAPSESGYLDANEFNSSQEELENAVVASPGGASLDPSVGPDSNNKMLAQSITRHSAGGAIFCTANGDPTSHIVSLFDPNVDQPSALFNGLVCRYKPPASNTGAVTVNAFDLGGKALVDHGNAPLAAGAIDGRVIDIFYDPSIGLGSWVLPAWANALYVGQTPSSPASVTSGEGWAVGGDNKGNLNFPGLDSDNSPQADDMFAFYDDNDAKHKAIDFSSLQALFGVGGGSGLLDIQLITASGTYTKTSGTTKALVLATGGGAGGGGNTTNNNANGSGAGGGGAGATALGLIDLSGVNTVECTIGAGGSGGVANGGTGGNGGSTQFGSFLDAGGGKGGTGTYSGNFAFKAPGGEGGLASSGLLKMAGNNGTGSQSWTGGLGGASFWGGGGRGGSHGQPPVITAAGPGLSYGAGGGGGDGIASQGGAGHAGCILILEFA